MENSTVIKLVMGQPIDVVLPRKCTRQKKPQISVNGVPIYRFLFDEKIVGCKLGRNEALLLSKLICHYLNEGRKNDLFIGGTTRVAAFLGVSKSTARAVIRRLLSAGLIYRNAMYKDDEGNEIVTEGCGSNQYKPTVYFVKNELLMLAVHNGGNRPE